MNPSTSPSSTQGLRVQGLSVQLAGRDVLQGLDLAVAPGRWTCIVGPNGAGKSTLLRAMAGLLAPSSQTRLQGHILWQGQPLGALSSRERARRMAWLGQGEGVSEDLRVWDAVMLGRLPHQGWWGAADAHDADVVAACLHTVQAWDWRERSLGELSMGERQRVLLARVLAVQAPWLLMDEPLANLDPPHQVDWLHQVRQLLSQGHTVVSVLHEIGLALQADDLVILDQGRVYHHGECRDPATHRALEAVFDQRLRILPLEGRWAVLPQP